MNGKLTNYKTCNSEIIKKVSKYPNCGKEQSNPFRGHKVLILMGILIVLSIVSSIGNSNISKIAVAFKNISSKCTTKPEVKQRQVQGIATDLGAGTFTVGKDIKEGLYDATPIGGQGNFIVTNTECADLNVDEVLGYIYGTGDSKIRVKLIKDEQIQLEGINKTHFKPVITPFVTEYKTLSLYSGRWVVGQDICKGRYVVTPTSGDGNFIVNSKDGSSKIDEMLGDSGASHLMVNLDNGDVIIISELNQVNFTIQN
ncbi:hypothetical protein ACJDU8_23950 [Clostridium sp. WILCCON 0269]|uniref:Uncharacterized protein n=1 Tax=Candidatus Clostridium eludens TaxID=3381663 RepID=A0ABW8SRL6_9CLOT